MRKQALLVILVALVGGTVSAQGQNLSAEYLKRAETIYANVWKHYRVRDHAGLFSENFPSGKKDTLTYMEGGGVQEKAVSFLWPFSGMLSATNVLLQVPEVRNKYKPYLDTCVIGMEQYRDTSRSPVGYQAYPPRFEKSDRYYDDNGLVGIDYMESYFNTKNPVYLHRAEEAFGFIISGWNNDLGGGVTWLEGHLDQKPACSNGTATLVALKIYKGTKNPYYLNWGKKFYTWMYTNLRDSTGVYSNDKKRNGTVNRTFYTYNSGFMLEAAVLLYQFTGDPQYLRQAQQLAKDAYVHFSTVPHHKDHAFKIDLPWFVTVLFRGYEALYHQDKNYKYLDLIEQDLNYAWQHARDKYGFVTRSWTPNADELGKPKWLLDEGCIAELYARLSVLKKARQ
ncbi:Glycosyl hydrolase family 76 [Cnuella takakiae]|uniref:Glycosyl hydrolase family 76 n=1 Tax=Cnuella takakiae TaxID=1302690 RepID=A0A1M5CIE3_9BACT|nr:glycoside hydrolase family 76 protein [Cnuella takakiae]OLY91838.1 hydrolase [Cnuella takakiae]SHF54498.1 Glycosyl hydrolase family 76 [Cnuella takakiae]